MDTEDIIVIIFGLVVVVGFGLMLMTLCSMGGDDCDTYENILANVTGKDTYSTTTMVTISNGKTTSVVPSTTTHYKIFTNKGNVSIPSGEYDSINDGDMVVLTKNLNKSSLEYNCKVTM